jgi:alpha-1,2-mannosyltransferase
VDGDVVGDGDGADDGQAQARACHRLGHELEGWLITGITAQLASPVSWTHHWIWLAPAVLLATRYARTRVQRTGAALAVVMLLIGSTAGQYLLVHGPAWTLPLAVLQRECLVSAGIWCCVTFLIHAIRGAREPRDAPLPAWTDPG